MQGQRREEGHMGSVGPYARLCGIPGGGRWRGHSLRRLVAPKSGWREKVMRNIADRALLVRYLGFFFAENLSLFPKNYLTVILCPAGRQRSKAAGKACAKYPGYQPTVLSIQWGEAQAELAAGAAQLPTHTY